MRPVNFKGVNTLYGATQEEYQPLPAMKLPDGTVITCWEFSDEEINSVVETRKMYFQQLTFNMPLQPILPMAELGDNLQILNTE